MSTSEPDYDKLAEEAERGYDVEKIRANPGGITPLYAVAWALWANDDATYVGGVYLPDPAELHLAKSFIEALASRGFEIRKIIENPCVSGLDSGINEVQGAEGPPGRSF